ncbi:helix-turn-helix domain-containing protein [Streptomyces phytohabitans]|uniref:helix-turn-helix domain-containing protein n=1 Tax=Streptomyces phytohabitans TaxID=1150371 RepID=UPI00345B873D
MNAESGGKDYTTDGADAPGWDLDPGDDSGAVIEMVGRQVKLWRTEAGLSQAEFGTRIRYSENLVYKVEAGKRIPQPDFLDRADEALGAGGKLAAMKKDVAEARYPKKVRDLAKLEGEAVELGAYTNHIIHALLQTEEYARVLFGMRRPLYTEEVIEQNVVARMARQAIVDGSRATPVFSFVQDEVTLRRPVGGRGVQRRQLERLLKLGQFRNVEIQVMPTDREDHAGLNGGFRLFRLKGGPTVGYSEVQHISRVITEPAAVQALEMQYGIIRAQALTPRESLLFIDELLGET